MLFFPSHVIFAESCYYSRVGLKRPIAGAIFQRHQFNVIVCIIGLTEKKK